MHITYLDAPPLPFNRISWTFTTTTILPYCRFHLSLRSHSSCTTVTMPSASPAYNLLLNSNSSLMSDPSGLHSTTTSPAGVFPDVLLPDARLPIRGDASKKLALPCLSGRAGGDVAPSDVRDTERDIDGLAVVETVVVRLSVRENEEDDRFRRLAEDEEDERK